MCGEREGFSAAVAIFFPRRGRGFGRDWRARPAVTCAAGDQGALALSSPTWPAVRTDRAVAHGSCELPHRWASASLHVLAFAAYYGPAERNAARDWVFPVVERRAKVMLAAVAEFLPPVAGFSITIRGGPHGWSRCRSMS